MSVKPPSQLGVQITDPVETNSVSGQSSPEGDLTSQIENLGTQTSGGSSDVANLITGSSQGQAGQPVIEEIMDPSYQNLGSCPTCVRKICGRVNSPTHRRSRIIGGSTLDSSAKYPWTARFRYFYNDIPGQGSLINDRTVVTTASTVTSIVFYTQVVAVFNAYDPSSSTDQRIESKVSSIHSHFMFQQDNPYDYNIAVVKLRNPVTFTQFFVPICLPTISYSYGGNTGTIVGWGAQTEGGEPSSTPSEITVPLYNDAECKMSDYKYSPNNICGGIMSPAPLDEVKTTCTGDDGAGLMYPQRGGALELIGLALDIFGQGCGYTHQAAMFTKVQNFLGFIGFYGSGCSC